MDETAVLMGKGKGWRMPCSMERCNAVGQKSKADAADAAWQNACLRLHAAWSFFAAWMLADDGGKRSMCIA